MGYVKKACIADNLAPIIDKYFAGPSHFGARAAWIAVLCYAVQIYCDFSGYTDMAVGTAKLIGYDLCKNFDAPYLSGSVTEFWRRWHISLSTWLRDYLYIPLGGNRGSKARTYANLMITMLLGGLWHGAAWNFVAWGGMHGGALAFERLAGIGKPGRASPSPVTRAAGVVATFLWVCVAWIFFRSSSFDNALVTVRAFVLLSSPGTQELPRFLFGVLAALAVVHWASYRRPFTAAWKRLPIPAFAPLYGALLAVAVDCVPTPSDRPFIYFQFLKSHGLAPALGHGRRRSGLVALLEAWMPGSSLLRRARRRQPARADPAARVPRRVRARAPALPRALHGPRGGDPGAAPQARLTRTAVPGAGPRGYRRSP